jgi:hypothetical protein
MGNTGKSCYCHRCKKAFYPLGIARHRAAHRQKNEYCEITYTNGDTYEHHFQPPQKDATFEDNTTPMPAEPDAMGGE